MSAPPLTVLEVPPEEEAAIRAAVRGIDPAALGIHRTLARPEHAAALAAFLTDPAVSDPIYDLPRPFTEAVMRGWIAEKEAARRRGEAILSVTVEADGTISGYSCITIWPDRSAAELAGATRPDRRGGGRGSMGAIATFGFMFETLGVRLIGLTAALGNERSIRLIDGAGFRRMGERDSLRPDGTARRSVYWELTRAEWQALKR